VWETWLLSADGVTSRAPVPPGVPPFLQLRPRSSDHPWSLWLTSPPFLRLHLVFSGLAPVHPTFDLAPREGRPAWVCRIWMSVFLYSTIVCIRPVHKGVQPVRWNMAPNFTTLGHLGLEAYCFITCSSIFSKILIHFVAVVAYVIMFMTFILLVLDHNHSPTLNNSSIH
jgi:hypothetical protein